MPLNENPVQLSHPELGWCKKIVSNSFNLTRCIWIVFWLAWFGLLCFDLFWWHPRSLSCCEKFFGITISPNPVTFEGGHFPPSFPVKIPVKEAWGPSGLGPGWGYIAVVLQGFRQVLVFASKVTSCRNYRKPGKVASFESTRYGHWANGGCARQKVENTLLITYFLLLRGWGYGSLPRKCWHGQGGHVYPRILKLSNSQKAPEV